MKTRMQCAVLVALAVACFGTVRGNAASAAAEMLVLTGTGPSSVDVTLPREVSILPLLEAEEHPSGWSWSGCGGARGFYLQPVHGNPMSGVGAVDLAALTYGEPTSVAAAGGKLPRLPVALGRLLVQPDGQAPRRTVPVRVAAGRYRVHLLGDGACTVRIPMPGLRGVWRRSTVRPTSMQYGVHRTMPLARPVAPAVQVAVATFPVRIRPSTFVISLVHELSYSSGVGMAGAGIYETCVEPEPEPTCGKRGVPVPGRPWSEPSGFYHQTAVAPEPEAALPSGVPGPAVVLPVLITASDLGDWYAPGRLRSGEQTAKAVLVMTPSTWAQGAMFALDLEAVR